MPHRPRASAVVRPPSPPPTIRIGRSFIAIAEPEISDALAERLATSGRVAQVNRGRTIRKPLTSYPVRSHQSVPCKHFVTIDAFQVMLAYLTRTMGRH